MEEEKEQQVFLLPQKNLSFVGRQDIFELLDERFRTNKEKLKIVVLSGLGGVGKTQIAVQYAHKNVAQYKNIFWIIATTQKHIEVAFLTIGLKKNLLEKERVRSDKKKWIAHMVEWVRNQQDSLFIYDDADNYEAIERYLPSGELRNDVLVTSRNMLFKYKDKSVVVPLFSEPDSQDFIRTKLGNDDPAEIAELSGTMGRLALSLSQACAYIQSQGCGIKEFLKQYWSSWESRRRLLGSPDPGEHEAVFHTWQITMKKIYDTMPLAASVLTFAVFLSDKEIPDFLLCDFISLSDPQKSEKLLLEDVLLCLSKYSLLERNSTEEKSSIHVLLQEVIYLSLSPEERRNYFLLAYELFEKYFVAEVAVSKKGLVVQLIPHIEAFLTRATDYASNESNQNEQIDTLCYQLDTLVFYLRTKWSVERNFKGPQEPLKFEHLLQHPDIDSYRESILRLEKELASREAAADKDYAGVIRILITLSKVYSLKNEKTKCVDSLKRVTDIFHEQRIYGYHRISALENLAKTYMELNCPNEAADTFIQLLQILYSSKRRNVLQVGSALYGLGLAHLNGGRFVLSLSTFMEVRAVFSGQSVPQSRKKRLSQKIRKAKEGVLSDLSHFSRKLKEEPENIFLILRFGFLLYSSVALFPEETNVEVCNKTLNSCQKIFEQVTDNYSAREYQYISELDYQRVIELVDFSLSLKVFTEKSVKVNPIFIAYYWLFLVYQKINAVDNNQMTKKIPEFHELILKYKDQLHYLLLAKALYQTLGADAASYLQEVLGLISQVEPQSKMERSFSVKQLGDSLAASRRMNDEGKDYIWVDEIVYTVVDSQTGDLYERYEVEADGDCGYTAFGITRADAYDLISKNLNELRHILSRLVQEILCTDEKFIDYLPDEFVAVKESYRRYHEAVLRRDSELDRYEEELKQHANNLNLLLSYLDYDVKDKQVDAGWAHPLVLYALAHIRGIYIKLWQLNGEGELIPHAHYPEYRGADCEENQSTDLLFINGNHFERLGNKILKKNRKDEGTPTLTKKSILRKNSNQFFHSDTNKFPTESVLGKSASEEKPPEKSESGNQLPQPVAPVQSPVVNAQAVEQPPRGGLCNVL